MSDHDDVDVNPYYSAAKIYLSKDILSLGLRLLGIIRVLRADATKKL